MCTRYRNIGSIIVLSEATYCLLTMRRVFCAAYSLCGPCKVCHTLKCLQWTCIKDVDDAHIFLHQITDRRWASCVPSALLRSMPWCSGPHSHFHVPALWPRTQPVALIVGVVSLGSTASAIYQGNSATCSKSGTKTVCVVFFVFFFPFWIRRAVSLVLCRTK